MAASYTKSKSRREGGAFVPLPAAVLNHANFQRLSHTAKSLLLDLLSQLRFAKDGPKNNGDLCPTWKLMRARGWRSQDTLDSAKKELLHYGFIVLTRQGEKLRSDKPNLYAITWWAINDCGGKLDVLSTVAPTGEWKHEVAQYIKPKRRSNKSPNPANVLSYPGKRISSA